MRSAWGVFWSKLPDMLELDLLVFLIGGKLPRGGAGSTCRYFHVISPRPTGRGRRSGAFARAHQMVIARRLVEAIPSPHPPSAVSRVASPRQLLLRRTGRMGRGPG